MKIIFGKSDSIYKILKTVEKINSKKTVKIQIDSQNVFFENIWWGKQLKEILETNEIDYEFLALDLKSERYYMELDVDFELDKGNIFLNSLKHAYAFFMQASSVHKNIINKRSYMSYILIFLEILVIGYLFYFFYNLISPSAEIYLKPSYSVESIVYNFRYYPYYRENEFADARFLSIPYHSGDVKLQYTLNVPVKSISYLNKPSKGKIRILNYSDYDYPLLTNTKFVTKDGLVFRSKNWVDLTPGKKDKPAEILLDVEAVESDLSGNLIGDRGNIASGTSLYIKNLKEGFDLKELYAESTSNFAGGETNKDGVVLQSDIDILSGKLADYISVNRKLLLSNNFKDTDKYLLNEDDFINLNIDKITINAKPGDKLTTVEGTVYATLGVKYVLWDDFKKVLDRYLKERTSPNRMIVDIEKSSISFGKKMNFSNVFAYPTKINLIRGYDFNTDINGLKNEMLSKIIGKDKDVAKDIILGYPEITYAGVNVHPNWYDVLPTLKSRIKIEIMQ